MEGSTAETTSAQFKAERKQHRNRWADFINRIAELRDHVLPGDFGRLYSAISPYSMMSHARLRGVYDGIFRIILKKESKVTWWNAALRVADGWP